MQSKQIIFEHFFALILWVDFSLFQKLVYFFQLPFEFLHKFLSVYVSWDIALAIANTFHERLIAVFSKRKFFIFFLLNCLRSERCLKSAWNLISRFFCIARQSVDIVSNWIYLQRACLCCKNKRRKRLLQMHTKSRNAHTQNNFSLSLQRLR